MQGIRFVQAHVAQSVEHLHGKQKVSGSIPLVGSTMALPPGVVAKRSGVPSPDFPGAGRDRGGRRRWV